MRVNLNHNNAMFWALFVLIPGPFSSFNAYAFSTVTVTLDLIQHWVSQVQPARRAHHPAIFIGS